jgi:hypothetical protein
VLATQDPTEDAMNFDEENVEKTLRLWAGITFSGVPVQSRRVWRGFVDDNATRFDEDIRSRACLLRRRLITQEPVRAYSYTRRHINDVTFNSFHYFY